MDITEVIVTQHHRQRQAFVRLDEIPREDTEAYVEESLRGS